MKASIYTRPNKPLFIPIKERDRTPANSSDSAAMPKPLMVHSSTNCFITPAPIAERMVDYAQLKNGLIVADPQAGTGNLLKAIRDNGASVDLWGNELNQELTSHLQGRFATGPAIKITQGDFLETTGPQVDRFIMNPPYSRRQAYKHIEHAQQLLAQNGLIIALVPCTFQVDNMLELEALPAGTFSATNITTKIIEIAAR